MPKDMDKWYKKGANVRTNIAKYCIKNDPKLVPWRSRGLRRGIRATIGQSIRKRSRGIFLFLMAFGSPLGPWGAPKPPQPFLVNLFGSHFKPKSRKRGIQKGIPKNIPKKLRKIYQKASKIIPEWKEISTIGHAPWKSTEVEKLLVFPIENVVRAMQKRVKTN